MLESERFKKIQQNRKCYAYIAAFVVFQVIVIAIFGATVMKIKTPSVRIRSVMVENLHFSNASSGTSPSFNMTLIADVAVRNKNFGHFKFDPTTVNVTYGDFIVGKGDIIKSKAKAKKTKRLNVTIEVSSAGADSVMLSNDLKAQNVTLSALSRVRGKVTVMGLMKKRKTANMNCSMVVNLPSREVYNLACK